MDNSSGLSNRKGSNWNFGVTDAETGGESKELLRGTSMRASAIGDEFPKNGTPKNGEGWKSSLDTCALMTLAILAVVVVAAVSIVAVLNASAIAKSTAEMDGMYDMMVDMNNLTNTISQAINLDSPETQTKINVAFLQILDMIDTTHGIVQNVTGIVEDSMVQVNEVNHFLDSLEYDVLFEDFEKLSALLQTLLGHLDANGINIHLNT